MNKGMMLLTGALLFVTQVATAKSMSCFVGVAKVADWISSNEDDLEQNSLKIVEVELQNNEGNLLTSVNGEGVEISLYKKSFADVYAVRLELMSSPPKAPEKAILVTYLTDHLVNNGPARDNGTQPNVRPGAVSFEYIKYPSGTFLMTPKVREAMQATGMWGKPPFTSSHFTINETYIFQNALKGLVASKHLKETDVASVMTVFNCTLNM